MSKFDLKYVLIITSQRQQGRLPQYGLRPARLGEMGGKSLPHRGKATFGTTVIPAPTQKLPDRIVTMLREAGAKEVHMRISSPPFMWPCYYGTDIPSRGELIACNHTIEEITRLSGADSLGYLPVETLHEMLNFAPVGFCEGCFTGNYPASTTKVTLKGKERGGMDFSEKAPCGGTKS